MAIIIKNKNSRIRSRCFSAKEIAFRRDQVSNEEKNISDLTMGEDQYLKRKLQHPLKLGKPAVQVKVGDSVYIKTAKSKLKAREMFKVIKVFQKSDEEWAIVQKADSTFRAKEYIVKTTEIFLVPVPPVDILCDGEGLHDESEDGLEADQKLGDKAGQVGIEIGVTASPEEVLETVEDCDKVPQRERTKRKSALKARERIRELESQGLIKVEVIKKLAIPLHGWDYDAFVRIVEDEDESLRNILLILHLQNQIRNL